MNAHLVFTHHMNECTFSIYSSYE